MNYICLRAQEANKNTIYSATDGQRKYTQVMHLIDKLRDSLTTLEFRSAASELLPAPGKGQPESRAV